MPNLLVYSKEITNANILRVEVGSNCPQGGDSGYGGRTYFKIENQASTDMAVSVNGSPSIEAISIEIRLGGDSEHSTFIEALEFALSVLRNRVPENTQSKDVSID